MYQTTTDPIGSLGAKIAVWGLIGLALWANVYHLERPTAAQADQGIIILQATATPPLPTAIHPALADVALPTPIPQPPSPDVAPVAVELPAPIWTAADLAGPPPEVIAATEQAPPPAPDPSLQYGTPEFNQALIAAHQDLPLLECPCGVDTTPAAPTAKDYAYSKARTR